MKFKNFNIEDVLGPDDTELAKEYIGKQGYFEDDLIDLNNNIVYQPERTYELLRVKNSKGDNKYVAHSCAFKYFLPLEKVKAKPVIIYRACECIEELEDILGIDYLGFVGRVLELKDKNTGTEYVLGITGVSQSPIDDTCAIFFGNGKGYDLEDLFSKFEINIDDKWRPFGVRV